MEDPYSKDFETFLSHTDEKTVLLREIEKCVQDFKVKSLLDIGAGNGLLALPLSKKVENYTAVESNSEFALKLKSDHIKTIKANFPCHIKGMFDMILVSHVISYKKEIFEVFIKEAFNLLETGGLLLIITYRGQEDDWTRLMGYLGNNLKNYNRDGFDKILKLLGKYGKVSVEQVTTKVVTADLESMINSLAFVASDGKVERKENFLKNKEKVEKLLIKKYKSNNEFSFPFQHFFIKTLKS